MTEPGSSSCRTPGTWARRACSSRWVSRRSRRRAPGSPGRSASSTSRCPATSWSLTSPTSARQPTCPLNVDSERCYPDDPGGVAETVALLAEAGAAGFSIEDYDPASDCIEPVEVAAAKVAVAAEAAHGLADADGAHRTSGEPHSRRRRPGRHDRPPDRVSRCRRRRRVRARALRARPDRRGRRGRRRPGQRPRTPQRADRSQSSSPSACAGSRPEAHSPERRTERSSPAPASCRPTAPRATRRPTSRATRCSRPFADTCPTGRPKSSSSATGRPSGAAPESTPAAPTFR